MRFKGLVLRAFCLPLLSGCATMFGGGGSQTIRIVAQPDAAFVVRTSAGQYVTAGTTPAEVRLSRKREYLVEFSAPGRSSAVTGLTRGHNGWNKVNFAFLIGGAIAVIPIGIDAATGARWKLEPPELAIALDTIRFR